MTNAPGKITIGFSLPYVATYSASAGNITFGVPSILARGVSVEIEPETSDDNNFYADNQVAESDNGRFTGGTMTLTVDGLFMTAQRIIYGLPEAGEDGWTAKGDAANPPYISVGFIVKSMSNGNILYTPHIILKTKFAEMATSAATQEEEIEWQTQELTASVMRSDNATHDWCWVGADATNEAAAQSALLTKLGVSAG